LGDTPTGRFGLDELQRIHEILNGLDYLDNRVVFDPSIARGLAYYTGPVFEAVSKLEYRDASGKVRGFGAICGGGRYDGLVEKLLGIKVPATGASIGVDRLLELLRQTQQLEIAATGPVLILVMDQQYMLEYQKFAKELRQAGIAAEVYYGQKSKMKAQMSYADQRQAPVVVIAGGNEFEQGTVSVKDLRRGKELSDQITDRSQWLSDKPAQMEVPRADLVATVKGMLSD
jgi:histidyl-tRNA synthetase